MIQLLLPLPLDLGDDIIMGTPPTDPLTLGTPLLMVIMGIMHMKRSKGKGLLKFGMPFLLLKLVVCNKSHSVIGVKVCLPFPNQVLPQHLVGIWMLMSNM